MSTNRPPAEPQPRPKQRRNPLVASLAWLWNRYSPHGEFPLSTAASTVFHILVLALIPLLAMNMAAPDTTPPSVVTVRVSDAPEAAAGEGDEATPGDALQQGDPDLLTPDTMQPTETEKVEKVEEFKPIEKGSTQPDVESTTREAVDKARDKARDAKGAVDAAKSSLQENFENKAGGGGQGAEGRAARPARWILNFEFTTVADYLAQYEGLGATIAFPSQGGDWKFFPKPSSDPKRSETRDLTSETRLYWVNEDPRSVRMVGDHLNVPPASLFTAFLPKELEDKMLRRELAFRNLDEEDIASTVFKCVRRGGGFDVEVVSQIPR